MSVPYTFANDTAAIANQFNSNFTYHDNVSVPIGSIIPFYDFNGALTFNASYWAYCNGQTKTVVGIGSVTLPDLSNRYLVGFGTEGGTNMGSSAWSATPVGNASHQISIQHFHDTAFYDHVRLSLSLYQYSSGIVTTETFKRGILNSATGSYFDAYINDFGSDQNFITNNAGSTTQTIQPRSILVRFIMRIA
jgi:hypothetical protein